MGILRLGGIVLGAYEEIANDAPHRRPLDDRERAIWYRGYVAGRLDERRCPPPPEPSAGLEEDSED